MIEALKLDASRDHPIIITSERVILDSSLAMLHEAHT